MKDICFYELKCVTDFLESIFKTGHSLSLGYYGGGSSSWNTQHIPVLSHFTL